MSSKFKEIFKTNRNVVIAMLHVPALPGCPKNKLPFNKIRDHVLYEADILANCGVNSMMIENMHDIPYIKSPNIGPEIVASMASLATALNKNYSEIPLGVQILTAGSKEAIAVAKVAGLRYIRCEGYTFSHIGDEGWIDSCAGELLRYRKQIEAENVCVFTDIKKKHSSHAITSDVSLAETAELTSFFMSDGLIITGNKTGSPASLRDVKEVSESVDLPIIIGSGVTDDNLSDYNDMKSVSGFIIGSHFKTNSVWSNNIEKKQVDKFMKKIRELQN